LNFHPGEVREICLILAATIGGTVVLLYGSPVRLVVEQNLKTHLESASKRLDVGIEGVDDKTLLNRIKRHFEIPDDAPTPRTNSEWREAINKYMVQAFGPLVKLYREYLSRSGS